MTRDLEIQNSKRKDAKGFKIPDTRALRERDSIQVTGISKGFIPDLNSCRNKY
jgi:hypothetical protein